MPQEKVEKKRGRPAIEQVPVEETRFRANPGAGPIRTKAELETHILNQRPVHRLQPSATRRGIVQ